MSKKAIAFMAIVVTVIAGLLTGIGVTININQPKQEDVRKEPSVTVEANIEYSEESAPATVTVGEQEIDKAEGGQGAIGEEVEIEKIDGNEIPTVEAVESTGPVTEVNTPECPEGEECGRGAIYPNLDISSPQAFANETLGKCLDVDGYFGSQCWDSTSAFFYNYAGRILQTCGTGAAKGTIADGCWQKNAGSEFVMIWNPAEIQAGDIAVYSTGTWGHIGMAMGEYNNGYFTLLGQNQGGASCPGGGSAGNIINLSSRDFIGAFRPTIYIKPEPEPEPEPVADTCKSREVVKGDTLGKIMLECRGEIKWGEEMNEYARHWYSNRLRRFLTVFDGWASDDGVGLFAGDLIEFRSGE